MGGACRTNGEKKNEYRLLMRKPKGKRPLGRTRCTWVDNIRMDILELGWGDVDWIGLAQDTNRWRALVNSVLNPMMYCLIVLPFFLQYLTKVENLISS
jgi:hypothetical protein